MIKTQSQGIAQTVAAQLGGTNRLAIMTGAKNFLAHEAGLSFQLPRKAHWAKDGINYIKVTLNALDLYNVEFGKIRGYDYRVIDTDENVYAEDLKRFISDRTGLALSL